MAYPTAEHLAAQYRYGLEQECRETAKAVLRAQDDIEDARTRLARAIERHEAAIARLAAECQKLTQ